MKIHGTAKGAALSTKDFGVAFGGAAVTPSFNDAELKCYWRFNEESGDILNQSQSDADLGSGADLQVTDGTYQTGSPPVGNSLEFNGSSTLAIAGTSVSQWDFMNSTTSKWTMAFWFKATDLSDVMTFFTTAQTSLGRGFTLRTNGSAAKIYLLAYNGTAQYLAAFSTADYVPGTDNWHFYVITHDQTLPNTNTVMRRDNANEETMNKSAVTPVDGDSTNPLYVGRRAENAEGFLDGYLSEVSIWDKVMSDDDQTSLYNDGNGLAIY